MGNFRKLIKNKNFLLLWTSATVSQITINMVSFMIITQIFEKTNSTIATSFVWAGYALAAAVFGPFGAVTADYRNRRNILVITNSLQAAIIFFYSFLYQQFLFLGYGVVFLYSAVDQFYVPAEAASLPKIVKKDLLPTANGILFITVQSSLIFGLLMAGFMYEAVGMHITLLIAAVLLTIGVVAASFLPKINVDKAMANDFEASMRVLFEEILGGFKYIKSTRNILVAFIMLVCLQVSLSILIILMPVIAQDLLLVKASLASAFVVLPAAVGAVIGTTTVSKILARNIRKKHMIATGLFFLSLSIFLFAGVVPLLPFWVARTVGIVSIGVAGFSYVITLVPTLTYLQEQTPGGFLGRVLGNIWFISAIATVVPVIFAGTIAELFGVSTILIIVSIFGFVGLLIFTNASRIHHYHNYIRRKNV
jgi:MFS family permease